MKQSKIIENLKNSLFPYSFSELGIVNKTYEGSGNGKYCCDVEVVIPGSLEKTNEVIAEIPISPIWATKNKAGLYAMPEKDMIVIVGFIRGNRSFPYIEGIYGNQYETADFKKDEFLITDGDKQKIKLKKDIIIVENGENVLTIDNTSGKEAIKFKTATTTLDLGSLIELKNSAGGVKGSFDDLWGELSNLATLCSSISFAGQGTLTNNTGQAITTIETKAALVSGIFK